MIVAAIVGAALALATVLPLAWKWQLGVARAATFTLVVAGVVALAFVAVGTAEPAPTVLVAALVWLVPAAAALAVTLYRFYRDPARTPPQREDVLVSPADGEVVYIRRSTGGELPVSAKNGTPYRLDELTKTRLAAADAVVVGIALNFLDVHVNRAPIGGSITLLRRFPGSFASLRRLESVFENERATMVVRRGDLEVAVVMIASRLVRRITTFVHEGDELRLGDRIGAIRFGSQVDLVVPEVDGLAISVAPGDRVVAGESIVAQFSPPTPASERPAELPRPAGARE